MIGALLLSAAIAAQPLPQGYIRLACTAQGAQEPTFLLDFPTVEFTKLYRGDIRLLYKVAGEEGSVWDDPKPTFVMDSWPNGLFIEYADAALNVDVESRDGPIGFALETAHDHDHATDEAEEGEEAHAHAITGACRDITEEALK